MCVCGRRPETDCLSVWKQQQKKNGGRGGLFTGTLAASQSQGSFLGRTGPLKSDPTKARQDTFPVSREHTNGTGQQVCFIDMVTCWRWISVTCILKLVPICFGLVYLHKTCGKRLPFYCQQYSLRFHFNSTNIWLQ